MTDLPPRVPDVEIVDQFLAAMREHGIDVDESIIADGHLHRYHVAGDKGRSRNAWATLHIDEHPAGSFGCNKRYSGEKFTWTMKGTRPLTADERREIKATAAARAAQRRAEIEMNQAHAAERALALYEAAEPAAEHPYLTFKGVPSSPKLRVGRWFWIDEETGEEVLLSDCALLVPLMDPALRIHSLQAILDDGEGGFRKQYLKGGAKEGRFVSIGKPRDNVILIAEGVATGLSLWQCTAHAVIVAFDAGNLIHVAKEVRRVRPDATILLCADNDAWSFTPIDNPGTHYAGIAAAAVNGLIVFPEFADTSSKPTDFNDLHQIEGEQAVRDQIERALMHPAEALGAAPKETGALMPAAAELEVANAAVDIGPQLEARHIEASALSQSAEVTAVVTARDFRVFLPLHKYLFVPTGELWPKASVNARVLPLLGASGKKISPTDWIDENQRIDQFTWAPGEPTLIRDRLVSGEDWIQRNDCTCFNRYRPPNIRMQLSTIDVSPWLQHIERVYGEHTSHIVRWLAHRVQRPGEKINHVLMLGGNQGIGKDTLLEPVKYAIGSDNFVEIAPKDLTERFNGYLKSVVLRVSDAHDLGEFDRYAFYERMKTLAAAPPNVLKCNEKYVTEYTVQNVCGVILTTNHKETGIYLPEDDRRHYVTWSELSKEDFVEGYFRGLYAWFAAGGNDHVAAYLARFDLTGFDAKAPPPKTQAFHDIVSANTSPENADMADLLDRLGRPDAVTLATLILHANCPFKEWLQERKHRRHIPQRLQPIGYTPIRNENANDGLWRVGKVRGAIYARKDLSFQERTIAAGKLCGAEEF